ncbi:MAG: FAD-dependent oxidoreductase [Acidobacteriota bacterium]|nr:FAD-dependent oxidoreductase [Acidobacteriota bacterium]
MSMDSYEKLLEPGRIGSVATRNRIVKPGAGMLMWHEDDTHMREEVKAFYERFAKGGVGLLIVEAVTVDYPWGARYRNRYRIDDDKFLPGLCELAEVIHRHGCPTFLSTNHDGPWQTRWGSEQSPLYGGPPVAASNVWLKNPYDHHNEEPRPLTVGEIAGIVEKFANAAERAQKAGFDGIDVNAASSHLFQSFLSPYWNKREDDYGGGVENRARFLAEVVRAMKDRTGGDFPVSVILNGVEIGLDVGADGERCLTPEDSRRAAQIAAEAGADMVQVRSHWIGRHVAGFLPDLLFFPEPPLPVAQFPKEYDASRKGAGANVLLAEGMKQAVAIPVAVVGRMSPDLGEEMLQKGAADFIAMNRRLHADPDLPKKLAAGHPEDVAPCTACDFCLGGAGRCRINGVSGTTHTALPRAGKSKNVVVIGGGPAGMEAARVSAQRGHRVTLLEKSAKLGGMLPLAAMVKGSHPEDVMEIVAWFERQLRKLGVEVALGMEVKPDLDAVKALKPDAVFLATGGKAAVPDIPGVNRSNVVSGAELHRRLKFFSRFFSPETLRSLSRFYMPVGKRVVIVGGSLQGCELAEFLLKRGREVTIVEKADHLGEGLTLAMHEQIFRWFEKKKVPLLPGVLDYAEVNAQGLVVITGKAGAEGGDEGVKRTLAADTVIPALPLEPDTSLLEGLRAFVPEVHALGDCLKPGLIVDAVGSATLAALEV